MFRNAFRHVAQPLTRRNLATRPMLQFEPGMHFEEQHPLLTNFVGSIIAATVIIKAPHHEQDGLEQCGYDSFDADFPSLGQ